MYSTKTKDQVASYEKDLATCCPQEGWAEQDPLDILAAVKECISNVVRSLPPKVLSSIVTIGITNQRETTLVWDKITGEPLYNAIREYLLSRKILLFIVVINCEALLFITIIVVKSLFISFPEVSCVFL